MGEKIFYRFRDAEHIMVELSKRVPVEKTDELVALYIHSRYGNIDQHRERLLAVKESTRALGMPPVRDRSLHIWKKIYRQPEISRQQFILKIQHEERKVFGKNHLADVMRYRRS